MSMGVFLFFTDVVSKHKFSNKFKRVITSLSGLTYGIYLIHVLILKVLHNMGVSLSFCAKSVSILIVSLITFIFAAIIVHIMKKVPLVGKLSMLMRVNCNERKTAYFGNCTSI